MVGRDAFEFRGTKRFEVRRRIGAGGMGIVYEALDRDNNQPVALKTLRHLDAQALYRLKNEFRAMQDLRHPNLVALGELIEEGGVWFFTMELINGVDFFNYVTGHPMGSTAHHATAAQAPMARERLQAAITGRVSEMTPTPPPALPAARFDEPRLRAALLGLVRGVHALHDAGMVHRDLKPSNIMVTREGRVVVLDFGLIAEHSTGGQSSASQVVGTAAYMAPEQAAAKRATPAADWHSVGVVLYEALTGRLPFTGSSLEILMDKQQRDPPPPRVHVADVPPDLDQLCVELLRFDPKDRPRGHEILKRLGADEADAPSQASTSHGSGSQPFVGRAGELELMRIAYDEVRAGKPVTIFVYGESGVGKSALIKHFTRQIEARNADAVILSGRCYERESMHFKAFDGVIDELSQYMRRLPDREVGTLLPRNAALLPRVFPVLGRVEVIAHAPQPRQAVKDPRELRTRVFAALRELLYRIAERHPLLITIDDLQWADADSALLLSELLRQPEAPPVLLMVSSRDAREPKPAIPGEVRRIGLQSLDPDSARQLARSLLRRAALGRKFSPSEIAVDARGNPLFIDQLVRHAATVESSEDVGETRAHLQLDEVIRDRVDRLPAPASFILQLVSVAGRPLYQSVIRQAARMEPAEFARHVALLRVANLVRGRRDGEFETIEPYHGRVQEAVMLGLDGDARRSRHARLAHALESAGATRLNPQLVVRHLEAAGELDKAAGCAIEAADRAASALAFDHAAEFDETVLRLTSDHKAAKTVRMKLGEALVNAGRGAEAADVFLEAARDASPRDRIECQRQAAEQLLTTGYVERGLEVLDQLLAEVGAELPATPKQALRSLLWNRFKLRVRGLRWDERLPEEIPDRALLKLDVYKTAAHGLAMVDAIRSADFEARGLLLALKTGESTRVGLFIATEAVHVGSQGHKSLPRARRLLEEARRIAGQTTSHYLITWTVLVRGFLRYFEHRFSSAVELLGEVERKILDEATGMSWELSSCRLARMWSLRRIGDLVEMRRGFDDYLLDAQQRGDRYTETSMRLAGNVLHLVADAPDRAAASIDAATWSSSSDGFHLQHWWRTEARAELGLYLAQAAETEAALADEFRRIEASQLLRIESVRTGYNFVRGRLALAIAHDNDDERARAAGDRRSRLLLREPGPLAQVLGQLLHSIWLTQVGRHEAATAAMRQMVDAADKNDLHMLAAVGRRSEGALLGGRSGATLVGRADELLMEQEVAAPDTFARMLAPGLKP